jgi:hypothetical protein
MFQTIHVSLVTCHSAKLLRDRKPHPSRGWLKDLPYKARKLEEQLFKTAPSLKEYLNEDTFKDRLTRVAQAITSQHKLAKGKSSHSGNSKRMSKRGSDSSLGSMQSTPSTGNSLSNGSGDGNSISIVSGDLAALKRQQQVNATLQEQILENIRQQQVIMMNLLNSSNQQGVNQTETAPDQMMAAAMVSQGNPSVASMGTNQLANQMTGQLGVINGGLGVMRNPIGSMNSAMGMAAPNMNAASMNTPSFGNGGMNAGGMNVGGMNLGNMSNVGVGMNMGGMSGFNSLVLNLGGLSQNGMNNANVNPLLLQQLVQQQQQQQQQQQMTGSQQSPAALQLAMMNFRNRLTGTSNRTAMDTAALMNSSMSSSPAASLAGSISSGISAPPLAHSSGINPTMPPPSLNASTRSSFTGDSGIISAFPQDGGTGSTDMSLSPNSFNWL